MEVNGNTHNNAVGLAEGRINITAATVMYDVEDPDPQRRFKLGIETNGRDPVAHGGRAEFNVAEPRRSPLDGDAGSGRTPSGECCSLVRRR